MLRIITDGAADLPESWKKDFQIEQIPVNIQFGEKTYLQYIDLDNDGFFRKIEETKSIPKTSQPTPYQFVEFYKKHAEPGDTILSIHVTSKLSGTYASSIAAAKELEGTFNVIPFDSANGSIAIGYMCREARILERQGKSMEEILARLEVLRQTSRLLFTLDTLEYARMGGRVSAITATLASLINLKPVGKLIDGLLEITEKVRTRKASIDRLIEMAQEEYGDRPIFLGALYIRDKAAGDTLALKVKELFNIKEMETIEMSISLAANFGPGTLGLMIIPLEQ